MLERRIKIALKCEKKDVCSISPCKMITNHKKAMRESVVKTPSNKKAKLHAPSSSSYKPRHGLSIKTNFNEDSSHENKNSIDLHDASSSNTCSCQFLNSMNSQGQSFTNARINRNNKANSEEKDFTSASNDGNLLANENLSNEIADAK